MDEALVFVLAPSGGQKPEIAGSIPARVVFRFRSQRSLSLACALAEAMKAFKKEAGFGGNKRPSVAFAPPGRLTCR